MRLRTMTRADVPAGMRLKDIAGWNQTPRDWERFLDASPEGCFVAEGEGRVCGTVATIVYEGRFAWIGMVLVDPAYRGQGIGTRLLEKAIEYLDGLGIPTIKLDATPQGKPIYERLRFVVEYEIERRVLRERGQRPRASRAEVRTGGRTSLEEIVKTDSEVFGADRSALLRSLHLDAPDFTATVHLQGEMAGYTLGRRGWLADHLGPWMARNEAAAERLLQTFLSRSARREAFVDCVKSNPFACHLLRSTGFEFARPLTRMVRGTNAYPGRPELLCAILGPEFG